MCVCGKHRPALSKWQVAGPQLARVRLTPPRSQMSELAAAEGEQLCSSVQQNVLRQSMQGAAWHGAP